MKYSVISALGILAHTKAVGMILYALYYIVSRRKHMDKWLLKATIVILISFSTTFLWGLRNKIVTDKWVFSSTSIGYNLFVGFNPIANGTFSPQPPYPLADKAKDMAIEYIKSHPLRSAYLVCMKIVKFWGISPIDKFGLRILIIQEWILIPLALVGFSLAIIKSIQLRAGIKFQDNRNQQTIAFKGILFILIYFILFHAIFYVDLPRFRLPVMPLICLLSILPLDSLAKRKAL